MWPRFVCTCICGSRYKYVCGGGISMPLMPVLTTLVQSDMSYKSLPSSTQECLVLGIFQLQPFDNTGGHIDPISEWLQWVGHNWRLIPSSSRVSPSQATLGICDVPEVLSPRSSAWTGWTLQRFLDASICFFVAWPTLLSLPFRTQAASIQDFKDTLLPPVWQVKDLFWGLLERCSKVQITALLQSRAQKHVRTAWRQGLPPGHRGGRIRPECFSLL